MHASAETLRLLKRLDQPDTYAAIAPELTVAGRTDFCTDALTGPAGALGAQGFGTLPGIIAAEKLAPMRQAVAALAQAGLPPVFAHVYDELWEPVTALRRIAHDELGAFDVLADAWVFNVPQGRSGWTPHRGCHAFEGGRTMLNVWIALTPATRTRSCMFVVPLDRDPAYPDHLESSAVPGGAEIALEVEPGTACVWDANVLHWGGEIVLGAPTPRMSVTYSLRRSDARSTNYGVLDLSRLDLRARLDLIAEQLLKYAHMERVDEPLMEWAKLTLTARHFATRPAP